MNLLVCGAGSITAELFRRLGEKWRVTLVDKDEKRLAGFSKRFETVVRIVAGDASSPVVLEDAGLADQDYAVAMTDSDRVNLAFCSFAREKEVVNILARVTEQENVDRFEELGVRPLMLTGLVARNIYQYLQDPRIRVTTVGQGEVELFEVEVVPNLALMGRPASEFRHLEWRIVGVIRQSRVVFPADDFIFQEGDRVLILGKADMFDEVCGVMECAEPHFPRTYGRSLILGIADKFKDQVPSMVKEAVHLAQNTKVLHIVALCEPEAGKGVEEGQKPGQQFDTRIKVVEAPMLKRVKKTAEDEGAGVVLLVPPAQGMIASITRPVTIGLAHSLSCPLLVCRGTHPYEKILAAFDGSDRAQLALETALDLTLQLNAALTVAVVREPEFLRGERSEDWGEQVMKRARELAHIDKVKIEEVILKGNPVRELTRLAEDYNLLVIGSGPEDKEAFLPHVGELLVRKSPCSVLVLAR
ncbi:MAG: NAD-binding protein [Desulfobacterales bacterium]|nr:NAD-binding protein [Desulfobacterales bacterium]